MVRCKRIGLVLVCATLLLTTLYGLFRSVTAQDAGSWLVNAAPMLSKVTDLPDNVLPNRSNADCSTAVFVPKDQTTSETLCLFNSPLGTLTTDGQLYEGSNSLVPIEGPDYQSFFLPTPDASTALVSLSSPGIGNYVGVYRSLSRADLRKNISPALGVYYDVSRQPTELIRDPQTGEPIEMDTSSLAFSTNGQWMLANLPHRGLLRVNMSDLSTQLFARPLEPQSFLGLAQPPLAISDDGRYAAANTDVFGGDNLTVFDLSTCTDQLDALTNQQEWCSGKDIWRGQTVDAQPFGDGILSQRPDMIRPVHLRFVNDGNISFSAEYAATANTTFKTASFIATAPGGTQHKLGLLGLGDSYISGQGAFDYRDGTDTSNDTCHLSLLSYPFILGAEGFNSYNSVACSGATTDKVIGSEVGFQGQVIDKIPENKRDKSSILSNFLPGYIYQQEFASTYTPEAMLLSIGGDDVGFASIVKSCVQNTDGGTCYDTYEDRAELINEINATYGKLVTTYTTLRQQSGGARLYVVGYPQIAQPGGSCGLNVHLNSDEISFSTQLISYLDGVVQQAAKTAGVFYVDTQAAFDGHRLCDSGDKAMNGLTAGNDAGLDIHGHIVNFIGAESYHPTPLGYQLLATAIATKTNNLSVTMPAPGIYSVPTLDPDATILQSVPKTGRPINEVTNDDTITSDFMLRGDSQQITLDGTDVQLQPGSPYQIVLHSTPTTLAAGRVDSSGNISTQVTVPPNIEPGFHTIHIYGINLAGESIDVQKVVYVAASADDYNGDGIPNSAKSCSIVTPSGQDVDSDDVDDACDADITTGAKPNASADAIVSVGAPESITATASVLGSAVSVQSKSSEPNDASISAQAAVLGEKTVRNGAIDANKTELQYASPSRSAKPIDIAVLAIVFLGLGFALKSMW